MPNVEEAIGPVLTILFVLALLAERFFAHHTLPERRWWRSIGAVFFVITAVINIGTPLLLPIDWIAAHSLLPGYKLGVTGGFVVGWVAYSFAYYLWHRFQHRNALAWRLMHQLHHSMARVDAAGFAVLHPLDILSLTLLSIGVTVGILGLDPNAAALVGLYGAIAALVQHLNIKTPEWLEWFMQRPEAHLQHHEYGVHAGNYSDLPLLDKLFGTYRAPTATPPARYGFDAAAEGRWGAMLAGVDVNAANGGVAPLERATQRS